MNRSVDELLQEVNELRRRIAALRSAEAERVRAVEALRASEEDAHDFNEKLTVLHEMTNRLSKAATVDDLCCDAVVLARERLGFSRVGIWFVTESGQLRGSFGVSEAGEVRDERGVERPVLAPAAKQVLADRCRVHVTPDVVLYDHTGTPVGRGNQAVAGLWDGEKVIGFVSVDDMLKPGSLTNRQAELLVLFASALGHLCSRKRAEEERFKLEAQVQHTQKLESLGVLTGGIAHDFNNLLMSVLGNADLALEELPPANPARQRIEEVIAAAKHAAELTRQMLAYSGKGAIIAQPIDFKSLVQETLPLLSVTISKKINVVYNLSGTLPRVNADPSQIRQIIMNLVTNASEAIGDREGVITISADVMECDQAYLSQTVVNDDLPAGQYVYIEVSDTGCGMDRRQSRQIFEPFYTTKFAGRGLGLAAVLGIVRSHKGAIKVYSELGRGTVFRILFPASGGGTQAAQARAPERETFRGSGTILLVDDEASIRDVGTRMLQRLGFSVVQAHDGRHAVDMFREHAASLVCVILDIAMPRMSGEETLVELRKLKADVPVIVTSGYSEGEVRPRFGEAPFDGFLQKPYTHSTLTAVLRATLAPRGQAGTGL
ncbi:response regulator [bacterium]|nr:response regulator [bacterium]